ncbi:hypothetical protein ACU4GR_13460 [Methylobacterium oryzae CBMB20]
MAGRVGYLFDFGTFKAGPVGEVAYAQREAWMLTASGVTLS